MVIVVVVWTGREARALRTALRMSVLAFARYLGVGSRTVSDWEAGGAEIVPTPAMQAVLDTALSRASDEAKIRFAELTSGNSAVCVPDSSGINGKGAHTDRRQAGKAIVVGGFAAALAPLEAFERIIHHGGRPVDAGLITAHEDLADGLARLHRTKRADVLFDQVAHHADRLLWLLDRPMATAQRRRLDAIVVASHVQAGMLAFNLADRAGARRYFATAQSVVDDAEDDTLRARVLGVAVVLHSPIESGGRGGDARRAVTWMREAAHLSRRADPATRVHAYRRLGLELAAGGDERGFLTWFGAAERLPEPSGQPDGSGFLARQYARSPELRTNRACGLVRVGRADEAIDALGTLLDPDAPRWTVMVLADVALARVVRGEPEQACRDLRQALDLALDAGYVMGVERIRGVRARFPEPWNRLACVADLDERLRAAA